MLSWSNTDPSENGSNDPRYEGAVESGENRSSSCRPNPSRFAKSLEDLVSSPPNEGRALPFPLTSRSKLKLKVPSPNWSSGNGGTLGGLGNGT